MESTASLPSVPIAIWDDGDGLHLALPDGLVVLRDATLEATSPSPIDGAARGPDGGVYCASGNRVLRFDPAREDAPEDVTADFGGPARGGRRVACTPYGDVWVEGCPRRRLLNGTFVAAPKGAAARPAPHAVDIHANAWSLVDADGGQQVVVLSADAPDAWQAVELEPGRWHALVADAVGFVWIAGEAGLRRFSPRDVDAGWVDPGDSLPTGAVTALGLSPDEKALAAFASGEILELDIAADGQVLTRQLATVPGGAHHLHADRQGSLWAATGTDLYRQTAAADAWQHTWERQPGRLPGGNHDIFSVPWEGRLYMVGGLTHDWGLPARWRVFDELYVFDPLSGHWDVVSRMRFPRRYNGIAELDGRIWIVGGEGELEGPGCERTKLDVVEIYDPSDGSWTVGPSLNEVRTDPFVMTHDGRVWAIGGARPPEEKIQTVESIGIGETAWRYETPLPEPTRQGHGCVLDGVLYAVSIDGVFAYDVARGTWDEDIPQPGEIGQAPLVAAYQGEIWMMGGYKCDETRCYDPETRTWRDGPRLPTEQSWGAAAVLDGRLVITGGAHWSQTHDTVIFDDRTWVLR